MKKLLSLSIKLVIFAYLLLHLGFLIFQRDLIYEPKPLGKSTPLDFGRNFETVKIKAAGDGELYAWWVESGNKGGPVLLYLHGNNASLSNYGEVADIFASYGWDVLLFDYRGYGASSSIRNGLSEESLFADSKSALSWLYERGVEPGRVIVWGHSLGAPIAARLARDSKVAGLVLEGSFTSAYDMSRVRYPWVYLPKFLIIDPLDTEQYVREVNASVLVVHPTRDRIVPFSLGQKVYQAAKEPKEFLEILDVGHDDFPTVHQSYRGKLIDFANRAMSRHLSVDEVEMKRKIEGLDAAFHRP